MIKCQLVDWLQLISVSYCTRPNSQAVVCFFFYGYE